jgi:SAM-dependent methyltransferase
VSTPLIAQRRPDAKIASGNPWYVADQFRSPLGSRGRQRLIERRWRTFGAMVRDWRERHATDRPLRFLDAGCGDGINLHGLAQWTGAGPLHPFGVDYNPLRLTRAARVQQVRLPQASLFALPFAPASFDIVLCNHVIEHLADVTPALGELHRVIRPDGLLIVGTPNEGCLLGRARNHVFQPWIGRTTDHVQFFTADSLTHVMEGAGFAVRRLELETFFFPCSYLNMGCGELAAGHWLMDGLRRLFPSQAGGLIVAAERVT